MERGPVLLPSQQLRNTGIIWVFNLIFVFAFVISVLAGAAGSKSKSWDFAAVWQMLLTLGYSIGGTLILRKPAMRSALNIGFMIAVSFFLSMQLLVLAVLSVGNLALFGDGSAPSSEKAVAAFSVILFLGFGAFTAVLIAFRDALLPNEAMADQDLGPAGEGMDVQVSTQEGSVL